MFKNAVRNRASAQAGSSTTLGYFSGSASETINLTISAGVATNPSERWISHSEKVPLALFSCLIRTSGTAYVSSMQSPWITWSRGSLIIAGYMIPGASMITLPLK